MTCINEIFQADVTLLTEHLSDDHPPIFTVDSNPSIPLVCVLDEGEAFVHGAAHNLPVLTEDGLHISLGHQHGVEVPDEDPGVQRTWIRLVGHVAGHQAAGCGGMSGQKERNRGVQKIDRDRKDK